MDKFDRKRSRQFKDKEDDSESAAKKKILNQSKTEDDSEETLKTAGWDLWGPYLAERQWGTVREDYSPDNDCWNYTTYEKAVGYSYNWGEDGLLGWCDKEARLCTSLALWNGKDHILKERLFGLSGPQGNHGEDVKELYYYTDSTPDHTYNSAVYKYPQSPFPSQQLTQDNQKQLVIQKEIEILDTGVFDKGYWDINIEYIKDQPCSTYCICTVKNCGENSESLYVLPQVYFRNTWTNSEKNEVKPLLTKQTNTTVSADYCLGNYEVEFLTETDENLDIIFTDNETSPVHRTSDTNVIDIDKTATSVHQYYKDGFHQYIIHGRQAAVNGKQVGSKCVAVHVVSLPSGAEKKIYWTIKSTGDRQEQNQGGNISRATIEKTLIQRKHEADIFYSKIIPDTWSHEEKKVSRAALAGLLWSKQFYYYHVKSHQKVQQLNYLEKTKIWNQEWSHMKNKDIISVPDKWEFPWYAPWDLAFQMIVFSRLDIEFSKQQMLLLLSDKYMKPNGQIPGCEFDLNAANPPLHAWVCHQIYDRDHCRDKFFLKTAFNALRKNFKWWQENLDGDKCHLYAGGFLGLDNISIIDRTASNLPPGYKLFQADGTGWMAFYCLSMIELALQLSSIDSTYINHAERFLDLFLLIAEEINKSTSTSGLWDEEDTFFYDVLTTNTDRKTLKIKSLVGLVPLFACRVISLECSDLTCNLYTKFNTKSKHIKKLTNGQYLISLVDEDRLQQVLTTVFKSEEFLSLYGIRSLSKVHEIPYTMEVNKETMSLTYCPGESNSDMFGGNSNWRGPIWLPMNYMFLECLKVYNMAYPHLQLSYPTDTDLSCNLSQIIPDICRRIVSLFLFGKDGRRPLHGNIKQYSDTGEWKDHILFYEYFNAETGEGCGASHQTGWTSLVVEFLDVLYSYSG